MINSPPKSLPDGSPLNQEWSNWLNQVFFAAISTQQSGPTTQRPTKGLWIGRMYYDTTLGKPVWVSAYSAGVATWIDAAGATV